MNDLGIDEVEVEATQQTARSINLCQKGCEHLENAVRKIKIEGGGLANIGDSFDVEQRAVKAALEAARATMTGSAHLP